MHILIRRVAMKQVTSQQSSNVLKVIAIAAFVLLIIASAGMAVQVVKLNCRVNDLEKNSQHRLEQVLRLNDCIENNTKPCRIEP